MAFARASGIVVVTAVLGIKTKTFEHGGHGGHRGNIHYLDTGWTDRTDEKNLAISRLKSPTGFPEYKPRDLVYPSEPFNPSKSVIWFDVTSVTSVSSVFELSIFTVCTRKEGPAHTSLETRLLGCRHRFGSLPWRSRDLHFRKL